MDETRPRWNYKSVFKMILALLIFEDLEHACEKYFFSKKGHFRWSRLGVSYFFLFWPWSNCSFFFLFFFIFGTSLAAKIKRLLPLMTIWKIWLDPNMAKILTFTVYFSVGKQNMARPTPLVGYVIHQLNLLFSWWWWLLCNNVNIMSSNVTPVLQFEEVANTFS